MTEFTYDLARVTQDHKPKIDDAIERGAQPGDTIHLLAPLNDSKLVHHTWYDVVQRDHGLRARFNRDYTEAAA